MKTFRDSDNVEWTVFEVRRPGSAKDDSAYLPSGYNDGWLCFETSTAKRRLVKYPEEWRDFGEPQLKKLLGDAQPAPRTVRMGDDLSDPPPLDAGAE